MTEDETFRKLMQRPLSEALDWLLNMKPEDRERMGTEGGQDEFINKFGWTIDEINTIWLRTNLHGWAFTKPKRGRYIQCP